MFGGSEAYVWEGVHDPGVNKSLGETAYIVLLEALASACHAADDLGELSDLTLTSVKPVGGFAILRKVEAEDFDARATREGGVV